MSRAVSMLSSHFSFQLSLEKFFVFCGLEMSSSRSGNAARGHGNRKSEKNGKSRFFIYIKERNEREEMKCKRKVENVNWFCCLPFHIRNFCWLNFPFERIHRSSSLDFWHSCSTYLVSISHFSLLVLPFHRFKLLLHTMSSRKEIFFLVPRHSPCNFR